MRYRAFQIFNNPKTEIPTLHPSFSSPINTEKGLILGKKIERNNIKKRTDEEERENRTKEEEMKKTVRETSRDQR